VITRALAMNATTTDPSTSTPGNAPAADPRPASAAPLWSDVDLAALAGRSNLPLFGTLQQDFAAALSRALTTSAAARAFPELVALGFWLRPAHLRTLLDAAAATQGSSVRLPRGLALHIAPGNVDTIFVYSWLVSLLCGNRSIVRLSSRDTPQAALLHGLLAELLALPAWQAVRERVAFVRYGHDDTITARLSALCDLRVIWGGDHTIQTVRAVPLPPHATELCFADKFSLTVLRAAHVAVLDAAALSRLALGLANDTFTFAQMACSSPRLVLWLGDEEERKTARAALWPAFDTVAARYAEHIGPAERLNKRIHADLLAMQAQVHIEPPRGPVQRVWLAQPAVHAALHCGGGLIHESGIAHLSDLAPLLSRRVQTVSQAGIGRDDWANFLQQHDARGIDRVVPVGQALDFAPVWDGHDLWQAFTREVDLRL
jgi:hypothetical protein